MEQRAGLTSARGEMARIEVRREKLVESIMEGVPGAQVKDELIAIGDRKEVLTKQLETANQPAPLLHPRMADLYRTKVEDSSCVERWLRPNLGSRDGECP